MSRTAFWIIGGVTVVLCVLGIVAFSAADDTEQAQQKAQELTQKLEAAGLRAPDQDIIVRTLGDDGGAVCDNAEDGLEGIGKAVLHDQLSNGASQVGRRPIIADGRLIQGSLLIVETYCPDELEDFRDDVADLKVDDVIG